MNNDLIFHRLHPHGCGCVASTLRWVLERHDSLFFRTHHQREPADAAGSKIFSDGMINFAKQEVEKVPSESLQRRPVTEDTHNGTFFLYIKTFSCQVETPLPAIGHRATAEALGCGDAANLRTSLGGGRPRN